MVIRSSIVNCMDRDNVSVYPTFSNGLHFVWLQLLKEAAVVTQLVRQSSMLDAPVIQIIFYTSLLSYASRIRCMSSINLFSLVVISVVMMWKAQREYVMKFCSTLRPSSRDISSRITKSASKPYKMANISAFRTLRARRGHELKMHTRWCTFQLHHGVRRWRPIVIWLLRSSKMMRP